MSSPGSPEDPSPRVPPAPVSPEIPRTGSGKQGGGGDGGGTGQSPCDIDEVALVSSPDRTVGSTVRVGDVLRLTYDRGPPKLLLVMTGSGGVLGSITSASQAQLMVCMEGGYAYVAEVTAIHGGRFHVWIRNT